MAITQQVLIGNCAEILKTLPSESVDCVVTSPPYWGLRDYKTEPVEWSDGWRGQLGLEPTPQLYIKHLVSIFDEVKRVLKPSGTCWVNLGDSYANSAGRNIRDPKNARDCPIPDIKMDIDLPDKCLVQVPSRFALAMTDAGWILRNEIIWHKPNAMPSSVKDRFTVDFEKMFFFVKSKRYYFEQQFEPRSEASVSRYKYRFGGAKNETIKKTDNPTYVVEMRSPTDGRNMRCVWTIKTNPYKGPHFAVFPPELVETPIKAGCPVGGVVLDPFGGTGTTSEVARRLGRASIIIELNPDYLELVKERARTDIPDLRSFEEVTP